MRVRGAVSAKLGLVLCLARNQRHPKRPPESRRSGRSTRKRTQRRKDAKLTAVFLTDDLKILEIVGKFTQCPSHFCFFNCGWPQLCGVSCLAETLMKLAIRLLLSALAIFSIAGAAEEIAPPVPQRFTIHSKVLNEDRVIWVRTPPGYERGREVYPVLYQTDGPWHVNETGSSVDFLTKNNRMPQVIIVAVENTDRTRDLTPTHWNRKLPEGKADPSPTMGGADKFLDFVQTELMPEVERRYRVAPYKIFAGHSLGGLLAIHVLITRPDMFNAYIAVSPSLQWDDGRTRTQAQQFFASQAKLNKTLFMSLASEGNTDNPISRNFAALEKSLSEHAPEGFSWKTEHFPDETHGSTVLRAHYAGLRMIFKAWEPARDEKTFDYVGGISGIEDHYRKLSERFGYAIPLPEGEINELGYSFKDEGKLDEAIAAFQRNVELYPESANVYKSLGEGLEAKGKFEAATENLQKAIALATKYNDANLGPYKQRLERITAEAKKANEKKAIAAEAR